ncbi:hypothetical protein HC928_03265 [bacterium]|nr:hypothetical protein [bacterium]
MILDNDFVETEPPDGGGRATVAYWISPTGTQVNASEQQIIIPASIGDELWQVLIIVPDDIMIDLAFDATAEEVL